MGTELHLGWVAGALALVVALTGCERPRGCLAGCSPTDDAGAEAEAEAAAPAAPLCAHDRFCPHVLDVGGITLGGINSVGLPVTGKVEIGDALYTPYGAAVPWVEVPAPGATKRQMGAALLDSSEVASVQIEVPPDAALEVPALFQREGELDLVVPDPGYDHVVRIPFASFKPDDPAPIALSSPTPPIMLGIGYALAAVTGPGADLRYFDASLQQELRHVPLGDRGGVALVATCNGLLSVGQRSGAATATALDKLASHIGQTSTVSGIAPERALWDGASVVLSDVAGTIVEVDRFGAHATTTHSPEGNVFGAVGTDDGVLVARTADGRGKLELLERGSGNVVEYYGDQSYGNQTFTAGPRAAYLVGTKYDSIFWVPVSCGK